MAATFTTAPPGTGCGSIEQFEQIAVVSVKCRKQGFEIFVEDTGITQVDGSFSIQFRRHCHLLAGSDECRLQAITEVELDAAVVGSHQSLAFLQDIPRTQLAQIACFVARPGLAGDGKNGCDAHVTDSLRSVPMASA